MRLALIIGGLINTLILFPAMLFQVLVGFGMYLIGTWVKNDKLKTHGIALAYAADQNLNTIWLGDPDETISSRCGRARKSGRPKWYIRFILRPFVDWASRRFGDKPEHCTRAIEPNAPGDREIWSWIKPPK